MKAHDNLLHFFGLSKFFLLCTNYISYHFQNQYLISHSGSGLDEVHGWKSLIHLCDLTDGGCLMIQVA